ncbi:class I SAM-dependent methyltransferase [Arsukibacterium sp.]|uniref:class I SAM-dependent methyltransferase n=1 Tax=Arsukibacterium sp. TaxID=1977258 RepID=UPI002FD913D4
MNLPFTVPLLCHEPASEPYAQELCHVFALERALKADGWHLLLQDGSLGLLNKQLAKQSAIVVDFASGAASYRRAHGGGVTEAIAKAVGLNKKRALTVLDATAGLGRDALVLASLGASLTLVERNPAVAALLFDGLRRAQQHAELSELLARMRLRHTSALEALADSPPVDVVFLDPMFPPRDKSALVKKEMRAFHDVVGRDDDADALLAPALKLAQKRVVVKRPGYADFLAGAKPTMSVSGKNNRFDVYVNSAIS